jgi:hypothetical protein
MQWPRHSDACRPLLWPLSMAVDCPGHEAQEEDAPDFASGLEV